MAPQPINKFKGTSKHDEKWKEISKGLGTLTKIPVIRGKNIYFRMVKNRNI